MKDSQKYGRVEFHVVIRCDDELEIKALYSIAKSVYEKPVCEGLERTIAKEIMDSIERLAKIR